MIKINLLPVREKLQEEALDEGFKRELEYVGKLSPKQAKEHITRTWKKHPIDAVRLFMKLNTSKGKAVLEQFRTPEEIEIMHELLEQIRFQDMKKDALASGKTTGDASP